jgi:oligopeptide transport system ATP-binding protein
MANMIDYKEKVLQVKNLKKYFRVGSGKRKLNIPAVDGVTFDIYKREVFGVVGESGSGKTTLGRTIIKLYQPTDGTVTLNNIAISAGILSYQEEIERIKKQLADDITSLDPLKIKAIELRRKKELVISGLKKELINLEKDKIIEVTASTKQYDQFRADQYRTKALMTIDLQKVIFDYNQQVMKANQRLQNESLLKYKNEVKIATLKHDNKLEGLQDSAALEKETIKQRIEVLNQEYQTSLLKLKETYQPQIDADAKNVLTKQQVNTLILGFAKDKNQKVLAIKADYQKQLNNLVEPDKTSYTKEKQKTEQKFAILKKEIEQKIVDANKSLNLEISKLPKSTTSNLKNPEIQAKITQLKTSANQKIRELKAKLLDAKRVNQSGDTLKESQKMQMIFQDPISSLNPRMTVKEIIGEGLIIQRKLSKKEIEKKVAQSLELVGLSPEYASRYPHEFSGGQRQRIGVARALIMDPNVIIADEPISALDVSIRAQVINLLFALREKLGLTILFIAHDLSVVRFFCDRIAVMYNGKVVEMAPSEELFKNPMHPYTVSLLSAIPQPDPDYEKNRQRIHYNPRQHQYLTDLPTLQEIGPNHHVYANQAEFQLMKKQYESVSKSTEKKDKVKA